MTTAERLEKAKEWHDKYIIEAAEREGKIAELQEARRQLQERLSAASESLTAIKENTLYKILPSWIREKIEAVFDMFAGN